MKLTKGKKIAVACFAVFMAFMAVCTVVAKGIYASGLPRVSTAKPYSGSLAHVITVNGTVVQGQEYGVYVEAGLRVDTVSVGRGDNFEAGQELFRIETGDLSDLIAQHRLEISRLEVELAAAVKEDTSGRQSRKREADRAREDYDRKVVLADVRIQECQQAYDAAQKALALYDQYLADSARQAANGGNGGNTPDEGGDGNGSGNAGEPGAGSEGGNEGASGGGSDGNGTGAGSGGEAGEGTGSGEPGAGSGGAGSEGGNAGAPGGGSDGNGTGTGSGGEAGEGTGSGEPGAGSGGAGSEGGNAEAPGGGSNGSGNVTGAGNGGAGSEGGNEGAPGGGSNGSGNGTGAGSGGEAGEGTGSGEPGAGSGGAGSEGGNAVAPGGGSNGSGNGTGTGSGGEAGEGTGSGEPGAGRGGIENMGEPGDGAGGKTAKEENSGSGAGNAVEPEAGMENGESGTGSGAGNTGEVEAGSGSGRSEESVYESRDENATGSETKIGRSTPEESGNSRGSRKREAFAVSIGVLHELVSEGIDPEQHYTRQEKRLQLEQAVIAAAQNLEEAKRQKEDGLRDAARALEDANAAVDAANPAVNTMALDISYQKDQLQEMEDLLAADGWVYARVSGRVTGCSLAVGERTLDGACLTYALDDGERLLTAVFNEEQGRHISVGTQFELKATMSDGSRMSGTALVDDLEKGADGMIHARLSFDAEGMSIGQSAELTYRMQTDSYTTCVSRNCIYQEGEENYYVYIVEEREGILGTEWKVRKAGVRILDQNDTATAIQSAEITGESRIVSGTNKPVTDGDTVRVVQ